MSTIVLIETLWNVNKDFYGYRRKTVAGINRNIVECKLGIITGYTFYHSVLIETLWNVNNGESLDVFTPAEY